MARNRYYAGAPSDHFDGERFFNPGQAGTDRNLAMLLRWRMGKDRSPWPKRAANGPTAKPPTRVDRLMITMVGHATVLIQLAGYNMLVDPVWSARVSPLRWAGPIRVNDPGIAFADLPPIDAVLITHNHYDHFDIATLRWFQLITGRHAHWGTGEWRSGVALSFSLWKVSSTMPAILPMVTVAFSSTSLIETAASVPTRFRQEPTANNDQVGECRRSSARLPNRPNCSAARNGLWVHSMQPTSRNSRASP